MIEVIIVLLILGIVAAVTVPRAAAQLDVYRARAAAARIAADLERVRSWAYSTSTTQTIAFDTDQHSYQVNGMSDPDQPFSSYQVELDDHPYRASLVSVDFSGGDQCSFNGFGLPVGGDGSIVVQAGNVQRSILVDGSTGKVRIP